MMMTFLSSLHLQVIHIFQGKEKQSRTQILSQQSYEEDRFHTPDCVQVAQMAGRGIVNESTLER